MKKLLLTAALLLAALPADAQTPTWWTPSEAREWQWMISGAFDVNNPAHMGTGQTAYNGAKSPATDPQWYDIDGFLNDATVVAALHAKEKKVICYIEIGSAESYRPDYNQFTAAVKGNTMNGYPDEVYVDIRSPVVVNIVKNRIKMCADKKFDAIEPDIDDSYTNDTGFPLTQAIEVAYMKTLSAYAHSLGVAWFGKNVGGTGDDFAAKVRPYIDGAVIEQCNQFKECGGALGAYKGIPILNAEYKKLSTAQFCPQDNARGATWNGTKFATALNGSVRQPCK